jgi:signal peptidase II
MSLTAGFGARRGYFLLSLAVLVADQASKLAAHQYLRGRAPVEIIPDFFSLWYSRNPGGLFGSFRDWAGPTRFVLLTLLPIVAIVFIANFLARSRACDRPTLFGLALILGGAGGNLIDRLLRGEVIDFLDVYVTSSRFAEWLVARFGTSHWPTFNVADSSIVVGACLLLLSIVRPQHTPLSDDSHGSSRPAGPGESL